MNSTLTDPFHRLSSGNVIQVLESFYDFTSLNSLLQISPKADEFFNTFYITITEAVLASCSMTLGFNGPIISAVKVHRLACACYDTFTDSIKEAKPARPPYC
ncbi:uncharacterized protein BDW43DRAFT_297198 [Aspergillus alliaceus]|uniref:uncharacterized protein n=1 Tax=Petromyces alliaceus TaxID=209559 RepID=UPI0012A475FD|nr:uncharacterized protein BDW43DRAFT_297198 [Aspergillus alliaceus]KAB8237459.1 hypothetical protein BDW43DRAFT_297198 [Aspergillus alliaceus]